MATLYYDDDADLTRIQQRTVAVLGYGSQGHAHARNLAESGVPVVVGLPEGSRSRERAREAGLEVASTREAAERGDVVVVLLPDTVQPEVFERDVRPGLAPGNALVFGHGFNIHYNQIVPPADVNVFMIAPKGPGHIVRRTYTEGTGVPALLAVHQDPTGDTHELGRAYARALGATRAGLIETTFAEETETDLFGEQAVLCGGVSSLVEKAFETLTEAGYQPEVAYFEVLHELKLIVDLFYEGGLSRMRYSVSDTAEFGDYHSGPYIVDGTVKERMREALTAIQDGSFARTWILENQAGQPGFQAMRRRHAEHPIEEVGRGLRGMMPFLPQPGED
ncbi:ketol-acid reductoisomerase [Egibacter rhizosphaerae]|uniref:Ketol-acid reductoisomerase (NADP(+)) n=1 Tax=Egibacter rhizosphaerae TaxID=1670831 RepID=A0A411YCT7_9ACTN|nr:ketol-acid reductoisomerase [Egibacter rhizosphaerae]QBI19034.1 ketol-acid reductoisomerase [Egibacter rhizosphaerae]